MAHVAPAPDIPRLASGPYDSPAPAIVAGDPLQNADLVAATKQLLSRQAIAMLHPAFVTEQEVVAAQQRLHQIEKAHFDIVGPDGNAAPAWVQQILRRMAANDMQQQQRDRREQQRRVRDRRRERRRDRRLLQRLDELKQESQKMWNRTIRTNRDRLTPVLRIEDGLYPPNFPPTLQVLLSATGPRINELLQFYNLPNNGTLAEKKERLQQHVGCNL